MKLERAFQQQVAEILGLSDQEVSPIPLDQEHSFYSAAFGLYEKGDYRRSAYLFTQLVLTDPFSEYYWKGLASAKQMAREYQAAVHAWSMVALIDENNPLPHFHAAECLLSMEEKEEALKAFDAALELAGNDETLCEKINLLKAIHYAQS
jgi:type III secretion system low calcium response chaperone LcrH/SycD